MVSQPLIQLAIETINKEIFTIDDVMEYLVEHKHIPIQIPGKYGHRASVAKIFQNLKKWEVIDRLPQGHKIRLNVMWYLRKNGNPHKLPCDICTKRDRAGAQRFRQLMMRQASKKIKISAERDHFMDENYQGGSYQYW